MKNRKCTESIFHFDDTIVLSYLSSEYSSHLYLIIIITLPVIHIVQKESISSMFFPFFFYAFLTLDRIRFLLCRACNHPSLSPSLPIVSPLSRSFVRRIFVYIREIKLKSIRDSLKRFKRFAR